LRGLLLGPWLNLHQTDHWHNNLLKSSDLLPVKRLLLLVRIYSLSLSLCQSFFKTSKTSIV
jgi:hypothetical protein